jgi:hypothetical protein
MPANVREYVTEFGIVRTVVAPVFAWRDLMENSTLIRGSDPESPPRLVQAVDGPDDLGGPEGGHPVIAPSGEPPSQGPAGHDDPQETRRAGIRAAVARSQDDARLGDMSADYPASDPGVVDERGQRVQVSTARAILLDADANGGASTLDAADGGGITAV